MALTSVQAEEHVEHVRATYARILSAFEEVALGASTATAPPQLDEFLRLVGRRLCELLDVTRCSVYLRSPDGLFRCQVGYCVWEDIDDRVKGLVSGLEGDRFTREIVESAQPVLVRDAQADPRTMQKTMKRWRVRSMLGVPLVVSGDVIGIIYVDAGEHDKDYSGEDVRVAQTFAGLAAVAVRQAGLNTQLTQRAGVIERQNQLLQRLDEVHGSLTAAVLHGAGTAEVLELLATLVSKPVLLYSSDFHVLGSASPGGQDALAARVPPGVTRMPWFGRQIAQLGVDAPSVVVTASPHAGMSCRHLLVGLTIEGERIGYLDVVEIGTPIRQIDMRIAEHGATVLALQQLSERRQAEAQGQAAEDFLADLLHGGRDSEQMIRRGSVFGLDLTAPHVVVRIAAPASAEAELAGASRRVLLAGSLETRLGRGRVVVTTVPGADVALIPLGSGPDHDGLSQVSRVVDTMLSKLRSQVGLRRGAVSLVCRQPDDYPAAHRQLRLLLELGDSLGIERVLSARDLGVLQVVVQSSNLAEAARFSQALLKPLLAEDGSDGQLVDTLRAFLDRGGRVRDTARLLSVHENTVRYRLSRIRELSTIDPDDLDSLLDARFALRLLDLHRDGDGRRTPGRHPALGAAEADESDPEFLAP